MDYMFTCCVGRALHALRRGNRNPGGTGDTMLEITNPVHSADIPTDGWLRRCRIEPLLHLVKHPGKSRAEFLPLTLAGALLIAAGVLGDLWCAWDFAITGLSFGPSAIVETGTYGFLRQRCTSV